MNVELDRKDIISLLRGTTPAWSIMDKIPKELGFYVGFTGIPTTFPFHTKWKIYKVGLTKEELLEWFEKNALVYQEVVIKI